MKIQHIVSVSGGKDSTALYCKAIERGRPFRAVFADTGNEHEATLEYIAKLPTLTGGPPIETVRADFSAMFAARREAVARDWRRPLVRKRHVDGCASPLSCDCPKTTSPPKSEAEIATALEALQPTGNPFLDVCALRGLFPSPRARFCTDLTKLEPMERLVKRPLLDEGISVVEWIGERAEESPARAAKPAIQRIREAKASRILYRPLFRLTHADVFAIAKRHGVPPNPLYLQGMSRVGCWPCMMEGKKGIRTIAQRSPETIDQLEQWEAHVGACSRRGAATFFPATMIPGDEPTRASIRKAVDWAQTARGGRQYDLIIAAEQLEADELGLRCDSEYGLCE